MLTSESLRKGLPYEGSTSLNTESLYHCVRQTCLIFGGCVILNSPLTRKKQIYPSSVNHLSTYPWLCRHKHQAIPLSHLQRTLKRQRDRRKLWIHLSHPIQSQPWNSHTLQQELTPIFDFQGEKPSPETPAIELNL